MVQIQSAKPQLPPQQRRFKRHLIVKVEKIHIHFTQNYKKSHITLLELFVQAAN
jgi:hypothetical protein